MKRICSRLRRFLKGNQGMTLTEVVVSIALLGILTLFILMVFVTSLNIIRHNAQIKVSARDAAGGIEHHIAGESGDSSAAVVSGDSSGFAIQFGGQVFHTYGEFVEGKDTRDGVTYHYFEPED